MGTAQWWSCDPSITCDEWCYDIYIYIWWNLKISILWWGPLDVNKGTVSSDKIEPGAPSHSLYLCHMGVTWVSPPLDVYTAVCRVNIERLDMLTSNVRKINREKNNITTITKSCIRGGLRGCGHAHFRDRFCIIKDLHESVNASSHRTPFNTPSLSQRLKGIAVLGQEEPRQDRWLHFPPCLLFGDVIV